MNVERLKLPAALARGWRSAVFQGVCLALWAGAVLTLPVTSLPVLRNLGGGATVAPPSVVFLGLLVLIWLLPYLIQGGRLPVETAPILLFGGAAVVTWALAFFHEIPSYRNWTILGEAPKAFLTLAIGLIAYLFPSAWLPAKRSRFELTLRLINWSGVLLIAWSLVQGYFVLFQHSDYPRILVKIQNHLLSSRRFPLYAGRVTGMAYEPSWLAHQLNMVYLPMWISATLHRFSAHRFRLWKFSLENFLLAAGVFVLLISSSRVGVISFMLVAAFLAIEGTRNMIRRVTIWLAPRLHGDAHRRPWRWMNEARLKTLVSMVLLAAFLLLYLASAAGLFFLGARFDARIARALKQDPRQAGGFLELTNQFAFAERVVYWNTGLNIFADHPFFGVGLGNAGFYFPQKMPTFGWALFEISTLLNYQSGLANTKSLWVRILAETGLLGFAVFLAWVWLLWRSGRIARKASDPLLRVMGLAGQLVLIGFITEGFSLDSFALPYFWLAVGLSSAAAWLARRENAFQRT